MMRNLTTMLRCGIAAMALSGLMVQPSSASVPYSLRTVEPPVQRFANGEHSWMTSRLSNRYSGLVRGLSSQLDSSSDLGKLPQTGKVRRAPLAVTAEGTEIWGLLISSDQWSSLSELEKPYGVYSFNTADMDASEMLAQVGYANGGGSFSPNTLRYTGYGFESSLVAYYYEYDLNTWQTIDEPRKMDGHMISICSAFDPTTYRTYGVYYGEDYNAETWNFGIIDYDMEQTTKLTEISNICLAMICTDEGQLYGITQDGYLNKIDKNTGKFTKIGDTHVPINGILQSAVYDKNTGKMYWAAMTTTNKSTLYDVDLTTGSVSKVCDFPNREEAVALYIPEQYGDDVPAEPKNLSLTFRNVNTTGVVTFDAPSTTVGGKKLSGDLTYTIKANGAVVGSGEAEVGEEEVTTSVKNITEGYNTFEISVSNSKGAGKKAYIKKWIGRDVPNVVNNVTFSLDKENGLAKLQWDYPNMGGVHGGYADPSDFTYKVVRYPDEKVVSEGSTDRVFSEPIPQGPWSTHYYEVYAVNNGMQGKSVSSNILSFGDALDLPYINMIETKKDFAEFTVVSGGENNTWRYLKSSNANGTACATCDTWSDNASDAWLIAPPVKLKKGYQYQVSFEAFANYKENEKMAVYLGNGDDMAEYKKHQIDDVHTYNGWWNDRTKRDVLFDVDADGDYRVGFNCVSDAVSQYMRLDSVVIKEVLCYDAPAAVTNLKAVPAENGEQLATISFNAPTKRNNGKDLSGLTKIEIWRDGELIKTFSNPAVGEALSFTDEEAVNGNTTYEVTAYNEVDKGVTASTTIYVGIDIPNKPTGVKLVDNLDGSVTLTWNKVTTGVNNQFIPADDVTYNIFSIRNNSAVLYKADVTGTSIKIDDVPQTGTQSKLYYGVQSQTEAGAKGYTLSNMLLSGAPFSLPYYESFSSVSQQNGPWLVSSKGSGSLSLSSAPNQDNDRGCIVCYPKVAGYEAILGSPKIALNSARRPIMKFYYYCYPEKNIGIRIEGVRDGRDTVMVKEFNFVDETGETGYRQGIVDLSELKNDTYDQILFHFFFNETGSSIYIDNISIDDKKENDLAASLSIPVSVRLGETSSATVTVDNVGDNPASDYTVKLYQNDVLVDTKSGETIAADESKDYQVEFTASSTSTDPIKLRAEVEYSKDEASDNNKSIDRTVFVYEPTYPKVKDLAMEGKKLKWSAVTASDLQTTDDFENYYPLETKNIGDWTVVDNDGGEPFTFGLNYIAQFRKPNAFVVNNPAAIGYDLESDPTWGAHGGEQYLLSFGVDATTTKEGHNDDWLISPLLSGKAQTAKAWIKSYNNIFGLEEYELLYSMTGKELTDFVSLQKGEASTDWTEISVSLPEGAKYFAIRHLSTEQYMFMVDDITYIPGGMSVRGYNIYRDGELLESVDADRTEFVDDTADGKVHEYVVTVVYEVGESGVSNAVSSIPAGIETITSEMSVAGKNGCISIRNAAGKSVSVYSVDGKKMFSTVNESNIDAAMKSGVYVVKVGNDTFNVTVK